MFQAKNHLMFCRGPSFFQPSKKPATRGTEAKSSFCFGWGKTLAVNHDPVLESSLPEMDLKLVGLGPF